MENQSQFDPNRKTVGAIYRDAQLSNSEAYVLNGDLTNELMSSLVEDLNDTIHSKPHGERSFFITVYEKKDLQMTKAILRRLYTTLYRPYPEDDTLVFYVDMPSNSVRFCWCLPHHSEMENILANEGFYDKDYVSSIKAWKRLDLYHFGFTKDEIGNPVANPHYRDKEMKSRKPKIYLPSEDGLLASI